MNPNEAFARLSPDERAEVILQLEEMLLRDIEDVESAELRSLNPERKAGTAIGNAFEILFRGLVNGLYLLVNAVAVAVGVQLLNESAVPPGAVDYFLWIVLPVMLIAWFFHGLISLLGKLGYRKAESKYGMIKLVSRIATWIAVAATVIVAIVWVIDRLIGGKRKDAA